jgi:hypothetical protein
MLEFLKQISEDLKQIIVIGIFIILLSSIMVSSCTNAIIEAEKLELEKYKYDCSK